MVVARGAALQRARRASSSGKVIGNGVCDLVEPDRGPGHRLDRRAISDCEDCGLAADRVASRSRASRRMFGRITRGQMAR
jgi:hypothetical protein